MKMFLMVVGLMALCYILQDAIPQLTKRFDDDDRFIAKLLFYPLAFVCYLCMVLSAPILLYMMWHDSRMEKVHKKIFLEDHQEHIDMLNNIIDRSSPPKNKD